jgi:hypothetical protein
VSGWWNATQPDSILSEVIEFSLPAEGWSYTSNSPYFITWCLINEVQVQLYLHFVTAIIIIIIIIIIGSAAHLLGIGRWTPWTGDQPVAGQHKHNKSTQRHPSNP